MESEDIGLFDQFIQRQEIARFAVSGARRIAQQGTHAQRLKTLLQAPAHVADAHDAHGAIGELETVALREHQQRGKHILHHRDGIAAGSRRKRDSGLR